METRTLAEAENALENELLVLLDCARCQEPMYHHRIEVLATYPLTNAVLFQCGECAMGQTGWEDVAALTRWPSPPAGCEEE
jgi:hypothetical protein